MRFKFFFTLLVIASVSGVEALGQKYITESGTVSFFSYALIENIDATNSRITSIFDADNGNLVYSIPIKHFEFDKSLMKEHFNENYLESEKFPKSIFKGKLEGFQKKDGSQEVRAIGELLIHGVTKHVEIPGTIEMKEGKVIINAKFIIAVADYEVEIPSLLFQNIAEKVEVTLNINYKLYEK